jgi:hypothetical protein
MLYKSHKEGKNIQNTVNFTQLLSFFADISKLKNYDVL